MGFWHNLTVGLKVARQIEQQAGAMGVTIKGRNPADVDAAVEAGVRTVLKALKKPGPQPVPSATGQ